MIKVNNLKLSEDINNIPVAMKEQTAFCGFYNDSEGNLDKKPISILTKRSGLKPDNKDKLTTFDKAKETLLKSQIAAVGFGLTKEIGIICIDLDCHNPDLKDKYEELKTLLLSRFKSYAETSISGTGTHIFIWGKLPECYKCKDNLGIIEVFDNRFIVTSGDIIPNRTSEILEEQEALEWLCETYLQKSNLQQLAVIPSTKSIKSDEEIINKLNSTTKGKLLMAGHYDLVKHFDRMSNEEIQKYPSKSEADLAFCNPILYYNGNDIEQAIRIFKASGMLKGLEKKSSGYLQSQDIHPSISFITAGRWNNHHKITG